MPEFSTVQDYRAALIEASADVKHGVDMELDFDHGVIKEELSGESNDDACEDITQDVNKFIKDTQ